MLYKLQTHMDLMNQLNVEYNINKLLHHTYQPKAFIKYVVNLKVLKK